MTSITKLPTTPGSIVTFTDWADKNKTEKFTYVVTLIPGDVTKGKADDLVWGDAFVDGDGADTFAEERILAGEPKLVHEAGSNPHFIALVGETAEQRFGEVLTFMTAEDGWDFAERVTVVYTPGLINPTTGEMDEGHWINSYGTWFKPEDVLAGDPQVIAKGL